MEALVELGGILILVFTTLGCGIMHPGMEIRGTVMVVGMVVGMAAGMAVAGEILGMVADGAIPGTVAVITPLIIVRLTTEELMARGMVIR